MALLAELFLSFVLDRELYKQDGQKKNEHSTHCLKVTHVTLEMHVKWHFVSGLIVKVIRACCRKSETYRGL